MPKLTLRARESGLHGFNEIQHRIAEIEDQVSRDLIFASHVGAAINTSKAKCFNNLSEYQLYCPGFIPISPAMKASIILALTRMWPHPR